MRIDSYSFGVMKVEGTEYSGDLIVFASPQDALRRRRAGGRDRVKPGWWRKEGHSLAIEDLNDVLAFEPEVLVIGKGASGMMEMPASTEKALQEKGVEVIAENTGRAWRIFNQQAEKGKKVAGAFHLTC
jgi:hypothetical protein